MASNFTNACADYRRCGLTSWRVRVTSVFASPACSGRVALTVIAPIENHRIASMKSAIVPNDSHVSIGGKTRGHLSVEVGRCTADVDNGPADLRDTDVPPDTTSYPQLAASAAASEYGGGEA